MESLLEHFIGYEEQDIDVQDLDGETALIMATKSSCPEAVSLLLDWGADPILRRDVRVDWSTNLEPFSSTPYEFLLLQINSENMDGFVDDAPDEEVALLHLRLRTLTTLTSPGGPVAETSIFPLVMHDEALIRLTVNSRIPRTKKMRVELVERMDGQLYLDIWGFFHMNGHRWSVQVTELNANMANADLMTKTNYYQSRALNRDEIVVAYTYSVIEGFLYQFLIEDSSDGWDETQDWIGPGNVLTWSTMVGARDESEAVRELVNETLMLTTSDN